MFTFQKVSADLADYGYTTLWLNNDWQGADFIAVHVDGTTTLRIQLKARLTFDKKYVGKDIYICFREAEKAYLYPHDALLTKLGPFDGKTWKEKGLRSWPKMTREQKEVLSNFQL